MINDIRKTLLIARYTFVEVYKSKIMMNVILLGIAMVVVCFVASEFTYGVPERVALDFGLGTLSISAVVIAIFMGVGLISKEIENRTIYMILSRPIKRYSFLLGRVMGMSGILALNILVLSILSLVLYLIMGGELSPLIFWAILFSFFEAVLILLVVVMFSLLTNVTMSIIYTISVYVAGHAISEVLGLHFVKDNLLVEIIVKGMKILFLDLSKLNLKEHVLYKQTIPISTLMGSGLYFVVYGLFLLFLCSIIFEKRNLD